MTEVDPLTTLLVGAFGAATLTLIGGFVGAFIQHRREHERWLRQRRYEAYRAFMIDMDTHRDLMQTTPTLFNAIAYVKRANALQRGVANAYEAVSLLGPRKVNAAGQQWVWAATDLFHARTDAAKRKAWADARWAFLVAAGKELESKNVGPEEPVRPRSTDD